MAAKPVHLTDVAAFRRLEARVAALETMLGLAPGLADWTPEQVAEFQAEVDGLADGPDEPRGT